ncbi:hypothetical protein [Luteibacter yeojuensis]|uniref:Uncharacterized protein n=1 Tax=Luteibacter yeojuensis TaxID=345309 RepID=A0A7X5TP32_9GAMM|nr:hypothetical protein [Luteibacter yeojuensis]NID14343.1 hypothetical protein [Luteibacter yeojuensis]
MTMHPAFAQALKPFAPPAANDDPLTRLLRLPFEVRLDDEGNYTQANKADVIQALDELAEKHIDELEARVLELTLARGERNAELDRINREAA